MEAFQLLSRGGARFNKKRFETDVQLFNEKRRANVNDAHGKQTDNELPPDLDFFRHMQGRAPKRKMRQSTSPQGEEERHGDTKRPKAETGEKDEGPGRPRRRVSTKGNNVPDPIMSIEALREAYGVPSRIMQNLREYGYTTLTAIQSYATPILLQGRDLTAISPTGTGKTLAYLIPMMTSLKSPVSDSEMTTDKGTRAIILAPTKELAHQIHNECMKLAQGRKWRIILLSKATASTLGDKSVSDNVDIIVSTPLRLVQSLQKGHFKLDNVRHLILDEADRLFDSEFLSQTQEVLFACTYDTVQKAAFSATLPASAESTAMKAMRDPIRVVVGLKDTPLPSVSQKLVYVADESSKLPTLLQHLSEPYVPPIMIFTSTQPRASSLAEQLMLNNVQNVDCLHAGMTSKERRDTASRMKRGECWILVCTEVMARGMDFKGVQGVISLDFPTSVQSYIHRIGRTGRAGREGTAITYFTDEDAPFLKPIANVMLQSGSAVPEWISKLPKPSKMRRHAMGRIQRGETVTKDDRIGKREARRKRDIIEASKRRKTKRFGKVSADKTDGQQE